MNPTPERALELAELEDMAIRAYTAEASERQLSVFQKRDLENAIARATILRAYADLSKKWQSVLNAEPVAVVCSPSAFVQIDWTTSPAKTCSPFNDGDTVVQVIDGLPAGTQLIIKPAGVEY